MATNVFNSVKEFNATKKAANNELKGIFNNPFVVINLLNKAFKGDFNKIAFVGNLSRENFVKVAKACKGLHKYSVPFAFDFLLDCGLYSKDYKGRICEPKAAKVDFASEFANVNNGEIVTDNKGNQLVIMENEKVGIYAPIPCTINAIFNAFAKAAKVDIKETEKANKNAAKAAKANESKELKAAKAKLSNLTKDYNKGMVQDFEFIERAKAIKAEIAKIENAA